MTLYELFVKLSADTKEFKGPMKDAHTQMGTFGTAASTLAAKLGTGIGLAAIGTAAIHAAEKFEQAGFTIRRTTGATGENLASLEKSFATLYKQSAKSAEEIAGALSTLAVETKTAGKPLEELVKQNLAFAKVMGSDVKSSVEATQTVFKQFNIAATDQVDALNVLYKVHQATNISTSKLTSTMASAGPILQAFGFNFKEVAILVGNFEEKGRNVESITGAMARAMKTFAAAGQDPKKAFEELIRQMERAPSVAAATKIALDKIGAKGGSAAILAESVKAGAFEVKGLTEEIAKNADSVEKAAKETIGLRAELTKWQHQIESVIAGHKDLVIAAPTAVLALGTIGGAVKSILPYLENAAGGMSGLFGIAIIASIWATSAAIDALNEKYESLGKKGKTFLEPWTAAQGKMASTDLGVQVKLPKTDAEIAQIEKELAAYANALEHALELFGLSVKKSTELHSSLGLLTKEYNAGRLSLNQYTGALTQYWQEMAKTIPTIAAGTVEELAIEKAISRTSTAQGLAATMVLKLMDASKPWGTQIELHTAKLDALTASMYSASLARASLATQQLPVDWSNVKGPTFKGSTAGLDVNPESAVGLRAAADAAAALALETRYAWEAKKATQLDWEMAQERAIEAERKATGTTKQHTAVIRAQSVAAAEVGREVRRAFDSMARGMAKSLVEWKGFGETLKSIGKDAAEGMLEVFIRGFLKPLEDKVAKLATNISDKLFDALGVGGSASSSAGAGIKSGVDGAKKSAGSSVSGVAGNMATAWIGAISSAVSAVSGVVSNFQFMAMNKSLDLIEHETRFAQIHLLNILEKLNVFLPATKDIWSYLWTAQYPLLLKSTNSLEVGGKGSPAVTININGSGDPRAVAQEVAKALRLQVPSMAYV